MSDLVFYSIVAGTLFILELCYFKIADRFNIIDKPNQRSSHVIPTIRGGGVVFFFAIIVWYLTNHFQYTGFVVGAGMIAIVSFMDDVGEQSARLRLVIQLISLLFMGWQAGFSDQPVWISAIMLIVSAGTLNAFNFMDGINGITGIYSLVNLGTFYWVNQSMAVFTTSDLILTMIIGVLVFLFFNLRKQARCFAGDVGSVTIAFVQLFLLLQLIHATANYGWILLFLIYGVDTVVTIIYRLIRRENIFKAHRLHLFQYFSNELGIPHIWVAVLYGMLQLGINIMLLLFLPKTPGWLILIFTAGVGMLYVFVREWVLKTVGVKGLFS